MKDEELKALILYLKHQRVPGDPDRARKLMAKASQFALIDGVLMFLDHHRKERKRLAVPLHLRERIMRESHNGSYSGHFAGPKLYNTLSQQWWWSGMYNDVMAYCKQCPECAIVTGSGCQHRPPLKPIPVERPFQKVAVDIMDLPCTEQGNKHVIVFQDMFSNWPLVFPIPDQRAERVARLLCEEVVPMFGVPEALLSDRGTNLLSHLMLDVCKLLGIEKLNTTAYHPECDGMVERFNRTLKSMLRKRAAQFNTQWDRHLPALLWAYRNAPHDSTGEKPSFLLFGWDCKSPTVAALLPPSTAQPTVIEDYREELLLSLSSARRTALEAIRKAQGRYKKIYDRRADSYTYQVGQWVLIRFPSDETGRLRKLSRPWHGPYRVVSCNETNVTAVKVYFPQEDPIQVHQLRVKPCPRGFPAGFFWYGSKRKGPGCPPRWVENVLAGPERNSSDVNPDSSRRPSNVLGDCSDDALGGPDENEGISNTLVDDENGSPVDAMEDVLSPQVVVSPQSELIDDTLSAEGSDVDGADDSNGVVEDLPSLAVASHSSAQDVSGQSPIGPREQTRISRRLRRHRRPPDRLI